MSAHICRRYFDAASEEATRAALELRMDVLRTFPKMTVNRPYRKPIGPHPTAMWSCEMHTPTQLAQLLPWLCTRNRGLSVMVHPNTGDDYADHAQHCYWLGEPLRLRLGILRRFQDRAKAKAKL